jgi:hypothetical protein
MLILSSELFGHSEDESQEVDTTENADNGLCNHIFELAKFLTHQ